MRRLLVLPLVALLVLPLVSGCTGYMSDPIGKKPAFTASLKGANQTPPTDSIGYGTMEARYMPTMQTIEWKFWFGKLSGPVTYAFLQGPDGVGNERADIVPIDPPFESNVQFGSATLTPQQSADLLAGRWSVEIRTERYPAGEIRGALVPK